MASSFLYNQGSNVPPGQLTQTIYSLVRGQRFAEAVQLLEQQLQVGFLSTAAAQQQRSGKATNLSLFLLLVDAHAVCLRQPARALSASLLPLPLWIL